MKTLNYKYSNLLGLKDFLLKNSISNSQNILLQIFTGICSIKFIETLTQEIKQLLPDIKIIGTTTSGEIFNNATYESSTILSFTLFDKTSIATHVEVMSEDSFCSAQNLIKQFDLTRRAKVAISFCDGLNTNGELYLNAFYNYDKNLVVAGGLAGDNRAFRETIVFNENRILTNGCVVALLYNNDLKVNTKANFGWETIGKKLTVTKVNLNRVYEIDNRSVVDIYMKYLGAEIVQELPKIGIEFPLIIHRNGMRVSRTVLGKNSDGSLNFAGNFQLGDKVTFGYGNIETILNSGNQVYSDLVDRSVESTFIYSCVARKTLFGESIDLELKRLNTITSLSGFFTYGEFYSDTDSLNNELLNQTMTILCLSENCDITMGSSEIVKKNNFPRNSVLKALSHLVLQTTSELEEINASLEDRVKAEVEKNRIKDQEMLNQARLVQMGEMMGMIAHQWRQPLSAISSLSVSLELKSTLDIVDKNVVYKHAKAITEYTHYLNDTINEFRNFFKPVKEEIETTYSEIVKSVLNVVGASLANNNIKVIQEFKTQEKITTYPYEIKQVLLNLIKNAKDILLSKRPINPYIKIATYSYNNLMVLEISDNGGGIPSDIKENIFNPNISSQEKSVSLGLYISKCIIEDHCLGSLSVTNSEVGAVFKIELKKGN
jgi:hypothetical protein